MDSQKLENMLNLALDATEEERRKSLQLNVGYDSQDGVWELIIKYSGNLRDILGPEVQVTELLGDFGILTIPQGMVDSLADIPQIEYVEKPKRLFFAVEQGRSASCMNGVQSEFSPLGAGLTGICVVVGCVV